MNAKIKNTQSAGYEKSTLTVAVDDQSQPVVMAWGIKSENWTRASAARYSHDKDLWYAVVTGRDERGVFFQEWSGEGSLGTVLSEILKRVEC